MAIRVLLRLLIASGAAIHVEEPSPPAAVWRIVNRGEVEIAWRIRSLQFFADDACTSPLMAIPGETGASFGSEAAEMTGAEYAFNVRSLRGWETHEACAPGACHLGFEFQGTAPSIRCILIHQGEDGFQAGSITLQHGADRSGPWHDVITWDSLPVGKTKVSMACPEAPKVPNGEVEACKVEDPRSQECPVRCLEGFGALGGQMSCTNGAWYWPQCLPVGTMMRLVATAPETIRPYWVILDAALYASEDCTDALPMQGAAISSGEFVIKYASYHPKNAWDGDAGTSWASSEACVPGSCWLGFQFNERPRPTRCVRVTHPHGSQYHATSVSVQFLGPTGWEEDRDVVVELLPKPKDEL